MERKVIKTEIQNNCKDDYMQLMMNLFFIYEDFTKNWKYNPQQKKNFKKYLASTYITELKKKTQFIFYLDILIFIYFTYIGQLTYIISLS